MEEAVPKDRETIVEEGIIQQESVYTEIEAKVLLTPDGDGEPQSDEG
jgi:hypothetical protein